MSAAVAERAAVRPAAAAGARRGRPHVYEVDPLRVLTALVVVGVHTLAFTGALNQGDLAVQIHNAMLTTTHFTREVFLFITGFTLTYVYFGKPFAFRHFWSRRSVGVLLPYCIWTVIYAQVNTPQPSLGAFAKVVGGDLLTGAASYQLYYITLTLQFYVLLPVFLAFLGRVRRHPWWTLGISLLVQVVVLDLDYRYLESGRLASSAFWRSVDSVQNSVVLLYQFFFILGGFTALYFPQIRAAVLRHGRWTAAALALALVGLWVHFFYQVRVAHEQIDYAVDVLQPIMVPYSAAVIACAGWWAARWAQRRDATGRPRGERWWRLVADASFGIYLVHALVLTAVLTRVVPAMPAAWPAGLRIVCAWVLAAGGATLISVAMTKIPVVSRLVGRNQPWPAALNPRRRLAPATE